MSYLDTRYNYHKIELPFKIANSCGSLCLWTNFEELYLFHRVETVSSHLLILDQIQLFLQQLTLTFAS
jgi:hypothetical protein